MGENFEWGMAIQIVFILQKLLLWLSYISARWKLAESLH
jgi:hypothetical protein